MPVIAIPSAWSWYIRGNGGKNVERLSRSADREEGAQVRGTITPYICDDKGVRRPNQRLTWVSGLAVLSIHLEAMFREQILK